MPSESMRELILLRPDASGPMVFNHRKGLVGVGLPRQVTRSSKTPFDRARLEPPDRQWLARLAGNQACE